MNKKFYLKQAHINIISEELGISKKQVHSTIELLEQETTIPFIARYRKEITGGIDEVAIANIRDRVLQLCELDKRKESILKSLKERDLLTPELETKISIAQTTTEVEDIYLPFRPKRKTRATIAKEKGLEPFAKLLFNQEIMSVNIEAKKYINADNGIENEYGVLSGARDIIAEWISEDRIARETLRELFFNKANIYSKVLKDKESEAIKYKDYFNWVELASKTPSHRILAIFRGEKENFLKVVIFPEETEAINKLELLFIHNNNESGHQIKLAIEDGYKRLLLPSIENEFKSTLKENADKEAIFVFANNLRQLLLSPPLGEKNILALDPGFRTGCKLVCLNKQGKLIHNETIFPYNSNALRLDAEKKIRELCERFDIEAIAVGNGTAGRETEIFVKEIELKKDIMVIMVNESGASIYSASDTAREEFPNYDITVRGAVSIGRRLMDPLSELVKIDPKSIGVGQYQHDVNQNLLKQKLNDVVLSCVNAVGVELNTASKELLTYVSGVGPKLAQNIIEFRNNNGPFRSRQCLQKVPRLGSKAFEQAAGFIRVKGSDNPLDETAVHPESYFIVEKMAIDLNQAVSSLVKNKNLIDKININKYVTDSIGLPTLEDIKQELLKPGRDPRQKLEFFEFSKNIEKIEDLRIGQKLPGIVSNVTNFGAFVDIGVHQDGLVHISQLAERFVKNPNEVLKVNQKVFVTVIGIDIIRKRIQLSLKKNLDPKIKRAKIDGVV